MGSASRDKKQQIAKEKEKEFPSTRHLKWLVSILLSYFGLRLLFFAVTISPFVPPDEVTHFGLCRVFSQALFLPENSPGTYQYGLVTNIPYLYYWTMGKMLPLNFFGISDLLFLRLLNIPFAFVTILFVRRMLRLLTDDKRAQVLLLVVMTNTPMFTFLSAFVTYDNLANLLAAMAVYYLLAFFHNRSGDLLAASFLCQLAGSLTKSTLLPLMPILLILLLVHEFRGFRDWKGSFQVFFRNADWRRRILILGVLLGLTLNLLLYGGNYVRYGSFAPDMSQVISPDAAMQNRIEARNRIFSLFKEGRISKDEALGMTSQIRHLGDRADAVDLIENYDALRNGEFELMGPAEYMVFWVQEMLAGIVGIIGHLAMPVTGPALWPFATLIVLTGLSIIIRWRPADAAGLPSHLMVIAAFYALFLMYGVNYGIYRSTGACCLALQGRYLFPVLGPISVISVYYLLRLFRGGYAHAGIAVAVSSLFMTFDLPYFLLNVTREWFDPLVR
jgi:hypothetical protein